MTVGRPRPIVLVVLDGFGIGPDPAKDAIAAASMPRWRALVAASPHAVLRASEDAVGLPEGQMGNSEVGHLNLGAGRPVLQDLPRIDAAIADGSFFTRPALLAACERAKETGRLHAVGLIGPGGVHAHDRHLVALVELAARLGVPSVRVHALLDGRDTPPSSALGFMRDLEARLAAVHPDARLATVGGRYWAMDRDQRWDRIERGYDAIVFGVGDHAPSATAAIEAGYARGETDEFLAPTVIDGVDGALHDRDPIVHINFRADRARQLTHALSVPTFAGFDPASPDGRPAPMGVLVVTMSEYESGLPVEVAFGPEEARSLAQAFSEAGWTQFHVAETEKYAHVTYFFNGGVEAPWPGEERRLVPSPRVATYDLQPEMSAAGVTDELVAAIRSGRYDFIVANFANPDMVGHTGVWSATVDGARGARRVPRPDRRRDRRGRGGRSHRSGRGPVHHRRPRERRRHARRGRQPGDEALPEPGPAARHRPGARRPDASGRRPRRRRAHDPRARRAARLGGDDGPVAARALVRRP